MGIYIDGMEMPTEFSFDYLAIVIYADGTIRSIHGNVIEGATAVPVPPHGRCIDADALPWYLRDVREILEMPTIIPADYPMKSASVRSTSMSKEITEINTASKKDDPVDTIQNDAYLLSCQCPVCMHSIARGYGEGIAYCETCGQKLHFPPFSKEEIENALFDREMDSYED